MRGRWWRICLQCGDYTASLIADVFHTIPCLILPLCIYILHAYHYYTADAVSSVNVIHPRFILTVLCVVTPLYYFLRIGFLCSVLIPVYYYCYVLVVRSDFTKELYVKNTVWGLDPQLLERSDQALSHEM